MKRLSEHHPLLLKLPVVGVRKYNSLLRRIHDHKATTSSQAIFLCNCKDTIIYRFQAEHNDNLPFEMSS
jgi:hypothetical protein